MFTEKQYNILFSYDSLNERCDCFGIKLPYFYLYRVAVFLYSEQLGPREYFFRC